MFCVKYHKSLKLLCSFRVFSCSTIANSPLVSKNVSWGGNLERIQGLVAYEDNHLLALYKPSTVLMQGDMKGNDSLQDAAKRYLR